VDKPVVTPPIADKPVHSSDDEDILDTIEYGTGEKGTLVKRKKVIATESDDENTATTTVPFSIEANKKPKSTKMQSICSDEELGITSESLAALTVNAIKKKLNLLPEKNPIAISKKKGAKIFNTNIYPNNY